MPGISIKDLIRVYRTGKSEVIALRGLDMDVANGEIVAIMGPSGCGKTTLLNLVGGLDRPTAGSITVDGENIVHLDDNAVVKYRRDRIGFIFQFFNLVPTLTAEENINLPLQLAGRPGKERKQRVSDLLELVGLTGRAVHKPDELSGGEQQRTAIAVALANDPDIILADEPTGELDTHTGQEVLALFKELNSRYGKTMIIVTHDMRVAGIAHRILRIEDGLITGEERGSALSGPGAGESPEAASETAVASMEQVEARDPPDEPTGSPVPEDPGQGGAESGGEAERDPA